jgi:hypothetical protein
MHPPTLCSSINRVVYAVSLGLVVTAGSLGWQGVLRQPNAPGLIQSASRSEDDRGSGRLTRLPVLAEMISFRGSGRIDTNPPAPTTSWQSPAAYRGSGRITQPRTS